MLRTRLALFALAIPLLLSACAAPSQPLAGAGAAIMRATCTPSRCQPGGGANGAQIFVEPDARTTPIVHAIDQAINAVWVEVYLLTDTSVIHALESAANRGVDVRVMLDPAPYGEGATSPAVTIERLQAAGVKARDANPAFQYTHAKMMLVDHATVFIMTCNLSVSGLGGSKTFANREYGIIDATPADVTEAEAVFQADWDRTPLRLSEPNLVISPMDARPKLTAVLDAARTQLLLEDEELLDPQVTAHLVAAARRGVSVRIVLPAPSGGSSASLQPLLNAGIHIRYSTGLYMHAKMIVADGSRGFVGSENFSTTSLDDNREVGVLVASRDVLNTLIGTFAADWSSSTPA